MITRSFDPVQRDSLLQFESEITKCLGLIDDETSTKIKQRVASAYTRLVQSKNAPYKIVFNESNSNFELIESIKELEEQKAKLANKIKLFKTIIEIKNQLRSPNDLENIFVYKNQLKNIDTNELTESQRSSIRLLLSSDTRPGSDISEYVDRHFSTSSLEQDLEKLNKISVTLPKDSLPNLQNELSGLNKLVDDTINDFKTNSNKKFQERFATNKKIGFATVAIVVLGFAVAAAVCAVVAPPLVAIPLAVVFACCSGLSLGIGPFISKSMSREAARYDSHQPQEYIKSLTNNANDISKKYFAKADDSKSQTAELRTS
jgi:hypothetical protein